MAVPKYEKLFNPILQALHALGGSGRNDEIADEVARSLRLGDSDLAETTSNGTQSRFEYRLAWARSYLKAFGLLENSETRVLCINPRSTGNNPVAC
jgi:restriction system protein